MGVIKLPSFMGGGPRPEREPAKGWDKESEALRCVGEWLSTVDSDEAKLRILTYWMWRLKSGDSPKVTDWVESIAEQSTMMVSKKHGFSEGVE